MTIRGLQVAQVVAPIGKSRGDKSGSGSNVPGEFGESVRVRGVGDVRRRRAAPLSRLAGRRTEPRGAAEASA